MILILDKFPFPPSSNHSYRSFYNPKYFNPKTQKYGRMMHFKDKGLKAYEVMVEAWHWQRKVIVEDMSAKLQAEIKQHGAIVRVDAYFGVKYASLFNREGARKQTDISNRIKALHDALARILNVDDRFFYPGDCEPALVGPLEEECVLIKMTMAKTRQMRDVYLQVKADLSTATSSSRDERAMPSTSETTSKSSSTEPVEPTPG